VLKNADAGDFATEMLIMLMLIYQSQEILGKIKPQTSSAFVQ